MGRPLEGALNHAEVAAWTGADGAVASSGATIRSPRRPAGEAAEGDRRAAVPGGEARWSARPSCLQGWRERGRHHRLAARGQRGRVAGDVDVAGGMLADLGDALRRCAAVAVARVGDPAARRTRGRQHERGSGELSGRRPDRDDLDILAASPGTISILEDLPLADRAPTLVIFLAGLRPPQWALPMLLAGTSSRGDPLPAGADVGLVPVSSGTPRRCRLGRGSAWPHRRDRRRSPAVRCPAR